MCWRKCTAGSLEGSRFASFLLWFIASDWGTNVMHAVNNRKLYFCHILHADLIKVHNFHSNNMLFFPRSLLLPSFQYLRPYFLYLSRAKSGYTARFTSVSKDWCSKSVPPLGIRKTKLFCWLLQITSVPQQVGNERFALHMLFYQENSSPTTD